MIDKLLRNGTRVGLVLIFPLIILFSLYLLFRKKKYKNAISKNYKQILINTLIILVIGIIGFYIFYSVEDSIYDYDYAGHWVRALELRQCFFEDPYKILPLVNDSMNYSIYYSYLIALLGLPIIILNTSYGFFCFGIFAYFLIPLFIFIQILYFAYFNKYKFLPCFLVLTLPILYMCIFDGETEISCCIPLIMCYLIVFFVDFKEIDMLDNISINFYAFLMIFMRRFFLYPLVAFYFCYFLKYLFFYKSNVFTKSGLIDFAKIVSSGLILLVVCIVFYNSFFTTAISNNYSEAYAYNNHDGKLLYFVKCVSIPIIIISFYGLYKLLKTRKNYLLSILSIITIALPTVLFWQVQSFEVHHYYMFVLTFLMLYGIGMYYIFENKNKILTTIICFIMLLQASLSFTDIQIPGLCSLHRKPKIMENKKEIEEFDNYLLTLLNGGSVYIASGNGSFNIDLIKCSNLPSLTQPLTIYNVFDLRDGFPVNLQYVNYLIISDPILYSNKNAQHIYDVITEGIKNESCVQDKYEIVDEKDVCDNHLTIYRRIKDYDDEIKQYFYKEMIKYYPNNAELFANILN